MVANYKTPEYVAWALLRQRCNNPNNPRFSSYGGRGITVCEEWDVSFSAFLRDLGRRPSAKHSIDRINNDGNYEPRNCRWATRKQQSENRRPGGKKGPYPPGTFPSKVNVKKAEKLLAMGLSLKEVGAIFGVSRQAVHNHINGDRLRRLTAKGRKSLIVSAKRSVEGWRGKGKGGRDVAAED